MESPNADLFGSYLLKSGTPRPDFIRMSRGFAGYAEAFRSAGDKLGRTAP
jgi:hypothetical protein